MDHAASSTHARAHADTGRPLHMLHSIPVRALGLALSLFFAISFVLCVLGYYLLPDLPVAHGALSIVLPGFEFRSWSRFFLGFAESLAWGWYIALLFGPLYNFFAARLR